jgi:putative ABC transport system permease protein
MGYNSVPPTIPAAVVDQLRDVPGVASAFGAVGTVDGARVIGKDGKVVTSFGAPRFGVNWNPEDTFVTWRDGRGPVADFEVAINAGLAEATGYRVGDRIDLLTLEPRRTFTVVGIFGYFGDRDSLAGETMVTFTTPVAQQLLLGQRDVYTSIDLKAKADVSREELRDRVVAILGPRYRVQTGEELADVAGKQLDDGLAFFNYILIGFATVTLFVGVFLILNTFSIIVAQRMREMALMRALGASRIQVVASVLTEAALVGFVSAVVGLGLGVAVGRLLAWLYSTYLGGGVDLAPLALPVKAVISSLAVGILVTMMAALVPALRAARIPPIAAMQEAARPDRPLGRITAAGAVVTAFGGALLWAGLSGHAPGNDLVALLVGVLLALIGVALLTPMLARPVGSVLGGAFARWTPGRLGGRNSIRNPRRTAITAAALMVGVALITGINVLLSSVTVSLNRIMDSQVHADLMISGDQVGGLPPTFDRTVLDRTRVLPGVARVVGVFSDVGVVNDKQVMVAAVSDSTAMRAMFGMTAKEGTLDGLSGERMVVDEATATALGLHSGDTVRVQLSKGEPSLFTIAGVYTRTPGVTGWITSQDETAKFRTAGPTSAFIDTEDGVSVANIKAQIAIMLADSPEVTVADRSGYVRQQTKALDTVLAMVQMLMTLSIIIAVLGIVNTLALSIIERTRELGLLRAIGLRRRQLMGMIGVESVVIAAFGTLLGIAVGIALGSATASGLRDQGVTAIGLPWGPLLTYLVLGLLIGVVAAVIPAIRAARLSVLGAIAYE